MLYAGWKIRRRLIRASAPLFVSFAFSVALDAPATMLAMRSRSSRLLLAGLLFFCIHGLLFAQTSFRLQSVRVVGSKRFSEQDLIAALGLKTGTMVDLDTLKQAADRLMQTGVLANLEYRYTPLSTGLQVE
jgi:outer membrane protein assembly factor BamA